MNPATSNSLTFQELILRLQAFWAERGCVLQQPYDVEVGAGTMAPETFLRVLGPKPYKVAYVQPSRRPADGRYGENPNRLFKHMQLQVILKPPPENVQEVYLDSLRAIGFQGKASCNHSCDSLIPCPGFWFPLNRSAVRR